MKQYQLFILTLEGHVKAQYDLICADDSNAKKRATKFYTLNAVEVWDGRAVLFAFRPRSRDARQAAAGRLRRWREKTSLWHHATRPMSAGGIENSDCARRGHGRNPSRAPQNLARSISSSVAVRIPDVSLSAGRDRRCSHRPVFRDIAARKLSNGK